MNRRSFMRGSLAMIACGFFARRLEVPVEEVEEAQMHLRFDDLLEHRTIESYEWTQEIIWHELTHEIKAHEYDILGPAGYVHKVRADET